MDLNIAGRTALVAGASRGIGLAIATQLHAEGCNVALVARDRAALEVAESAFGRRASAHCVDVTNAKATESLVTAVVERWGGLDIVVCNVGSGVSVPPGQETEAEWRRVFDVNLISAANVIAASRPSLRRSLNASIVCISSICGLAALGAPVAYSGAKAALNAMVRSLARPLARENIRINAVAPGNILFAGGTWEKKVAQDADAVQTMLDQNVAMSRFGTPEEIANLVTFLASPRASFATGAIYVADGGQLRG